MKANGESWGAGFRLGGLRLSGRASRAVRLTGKWLIKALCGLVPWPL
jgi:hypothetical protein